METFIKVDVQIDNGEASSSITQVFGSISLDSISEIEGAICDEVSDLDLDGVDFDDFEGYAQLTLKIDRSHNPRTSGYDFNITLVDSYVHPLI